MTQITASNSRGRLASLVLTILLVAVALRAAASATRPLDEISDDGEFYMSFARMAAEGEPLLARYHHWDPVPRYFYNTSVGPIYPAFLAAFLATFPSEEAALIGVRIVQIVLDVLSVWLVYRIGTRLFGQEAGLVAMAAMALDIRFILQVPDPSTETLYITLQLAGFALYLAAVRSQRLRDFALSGVVFGLATLTRPVPLLLPLALLGHALFAGKERARLLKSVAVMGLALWATITPWMIRNYIVTEGEFIPITDVAASTFWLGSREDGRYHGQTDFNEARVEEIGLPELDEETQRDEEESQKYVRTGLQNILARPLNYVGQRARNTLDALLQPYGTVHFAGPSIKETAGRWLRGEASLREVLTTPGFGPKLVVYVFHYACVGLGLAGLVLSWRRWRELLPLVLMLAYGTAIYVPLLIIPRYLFPLMPFYWMAAGYAVVWLWSRLVRREAAPRVATVASASGARSR